MKVVQQVPKNIVVLRRRTFEKPVIIFAGVLECDLSRLGRCLLPYFTIMDTMCQDLLKMVKFGSSAKIWNSITQWLYQICHINSVVQFIFGTVVKPASSWKSFTKLFKVHNDHFTLLHVGAMNFAPLGPIFQEGVLNLFM